jgi:hypothetical protein
MFTVSWSPNSSTLIYISYNYIYAQRALHARTHQRHHKTVHLMNYLLLGEGTDVETDLDLTDEQPMEDLQRFFGEPGLARSECALEWWKVN